MWFILLMLTSLAGSSQSDSALLVRLEKFLELHENMEVEKAMEYTYPRLFALVSREELKKEMENALGNEEVSIRMDSLRVDTVFPVFEFEKGWYAKAIYKMKMHMRLIDWEEADTELLVAIYEHQFGVGNVKYDTAKKEFIIYNRSEIVAIRDEISPEWTFLNLELDSPLIEILFEKKLLEQLGRYK